MGSSASYDVSICLRDGREWLYQSISLSHFLIILNLSTSSFSSATRQIIHLVTPHRQVLCLLPLDTKDRIWHSLQPETWIAACLHENSLWVSTCLLAMALWQVETIALFLLTPLIELAS